MKLLIAILLLISPTLVKAQEVTIIDKSVTGYKANVSKQGSTFGLRTDEVPATTVYEGRVTVTTAGTRVQLSSSSIPVRSVCVKALTANTGNMLVGDSTVSVSNGYELPKDLSVCLDVNNLNLVYVDATVNGEKVCYIGIN